MSEKTRLSSPEAILFPPSAKDECKESVRPLALSTRARWRFVEVKRVPSPHGRLALPHASVTFSTRFNKPAHFMDPPDVCCRFCSLLSWKEDIISSLLSPHAVGVTMGTWELLCSGACFIVLRDNSCLYLWQANRLIKGGHVCFLCPIPSPEQTLPYLRSAACAASTFPSPVRGWGVGGGWHAWT